MRILVLQESDWIERGPHQSHHLFERLRQRGHDVRVIDYEIGWRGRPRAGAFVPRKLIRARPKTVDGPEIDVIRPSFLRIPILEYASAFVTHRIEIHRQISQFQPDVIVGLSILNSFSGIRLAEQAGIPFVYYLIDEVHELVPQRAFRAVARAVEQWNVRHSSLVLTINQALSEYATGMGVPLDRTKVVPAGIELGRYLSTADGLAIREQLGFGANDLILFFMGWVYPFSGIREIAQSLVRDEDRSVRLLVVGRGEVWSELVATVTQSGAGDRIKLLDFRPYAEMPALLAAASVCVLPALPVETMLNIVPIKMYEYLAAGKPVIATNLPGLFREFGQGHGVVFVQGPEDVVREARKLRDSGQLRVLGEQGRSFVSKNDWNTIANAFERYLEDLIENTKKS